MWAGADYARVVSCEPLFVNKKERSERVLRRGEKRRAGESRGGQGRAKPKTEHLSKMEEERKGRGKKGKTKLNPAPATDGNGDRREEAVVREMSLRRACHVEKRDNEGSCRGRLRSLDPFFRRRTLPESACRWLLISPVGRFPRRTAART